MDQTSEPLLDREPPVMAYSPRARTARQRSTLSLKRCCVGTCAVVTVGVVVTICYGLFSLGQHLIGTFTRPHQDVHAKAAGLNDTNLVRPFYGPGSIEYFDIGIMLWMTSPDHVSEVQALDRDDSSASDLAAGTATDAIDKAEVSRRWVPILQEIVARNVRYDDKVVRVTKRVTLPASTVLKLSDSSAWNTTHVVGTIVMLPPANLKSEVDWHTFRTSRNASLFSIEGQLPPAWLWPESARFGNAAEKFIEASAAYDHLLMWAHPPKSAQNESVPLLGDPLDPTPPFSTFKPVVKTRSWIVNTYDNASYDHKRFMVQMRRLKNTIEHCSQEMSKGPHQPDWNCARTFNVAGHFENLIQGDLGEDVLGPNPTQWRYGPFLQAASNKIFTSPKDRAPLDPSGHDMTFNWTITFSRTRPSVKHFGFNENGMSYDAREIHVVEDYSNMTRHELAQTHEYALWQNTFLGHHIEEGARPVQRLLTTIAGAPIMIVAEFLDIHYWMSRCVSTGISLPMAIASSSVNVLQVAAEGAAAITTGDTILMFIWFIFAVSTISVFFFQIALYAKVDWVWTSWFRASFTRRRATHRERRSAREDARFTWPMRGTVFAFLLTLQVLEQHGKLPPLIAAGDAHEDEIRELPTWVGRTLQIVAPVAGSIGHTQEISQLILNARLGTFGGTYRSYAILHFIGQLSMDAPTLFASTWFGPTDLLTPFQTTKLVVLLLSFVRVVTVLLYPPVNQNEDEEDE